MSVACPTVYWRGAYVSGIAVDAQATATLDFAPVTPKVRLDAKGRRSNRYRFKSVQAQRVGPNTVGGGVIDAVTCGGETVTNLSGVPFYSGTPPIECPTDLEGWNPRTITVVFTCRSSVTSSFQVAACIEDLGPDPGYTPEET